MNGLNGEKKFTDNSVPDAARYLFDLGVPVLPFKLVHHDGKQKPDKVPLLGDVGQWGQWRTRPQTLQEVEALPWPQADGWFIVLGVEVDGYYLQAIDRDSSDFDLSLLPDTVIEKTPNGGYHALYWSKKNHQGKKYHGYKLEFLGDGNLCGMYPVPQSLPSDYDQIAKVDDAWQVFSDLAERMGCLVDVAPETVNISRILEGCPEHGDSTHPARDQAAIRLATYYRTRGKSSEETLQLLREWDTKNTPPLFDSILRQKVTQAFKVKDPYPWRFIEDSTSAPIIKSLKRKLTAVDLKDSIFSPTPSEPLEYTSTDELWNTIVTFTKEYVELPEPVCYDVVAGFSMATWRVEQATTATYLNILAPQGSGKSKLLELLNWLCRMSIHSEGATRSAIVRACNGTNATLLLDEADNWLDERDYDNQIMAVLNGGYRRRLFGGGTLLTENTGTNKFEVKAYDSFGFKVIAGRNPLGPTLGSRCYEIRIRKSDRVFPTHVDYEKAWELRRQLLAYSQNHKDVPLECRQVDQPLILSNMEERITDGRVREIFEPMVACAPNDEIRNRLLTEAVKVCHERNVQEQASDDAVVAAAIMKMAVGNSTVAISTVVDYLNTGITNPVEKWIHRRVGAIARRLGYTISHTMHGNTIQVDEKISNYLTERYSIHEGMKQ